MNAILRLQEIIGEGECALFTDEINRRYFTKMKSSAGAVIIFKQAAYLIIDFRYYEKAAAKVTDCEVIKQNRLYHQINELIKKHGAGRVLVDDSAMTLSEFFSIRDNLRASVMQKSGLCTSVSALREIKQESEKEKIIKAQRIAEKAYLELLNFISAGRSEREIALELNRLMFCYGAEDISFETIALGGKNTSIPHGTPSDYILQNGDLLLLDFGAMYDGYHSDMTRTIAIGDIDDKKAIAYDTVLSAQLAALGKIKAGVKCSDIDKSARDIIDSAGYQGRFGHSFGHGVGLEIHESPNVSSNNETLLKSGMVITAEPGVYFEGEFGIRIEDFGMVTDDGFKNFTKADKSLIKLK